MNKLENNYQEALDNLVHCKLETKCKECKYKYRCTIERDSTILQELVNKETPKKPIFEELTRPDGKGGKEFWKNLYKCPTCEENYMKNRFINHFNSLDKGIPYCAYCGQKLDWSDGND